ncbi:hypothetical protein [Rhodococcoides kyotonense]|uniref:Uncharacterized protein n=1 Tax=Rhodococcoides kyotonense TaxID=398843 RepID=A0A239FNL0_9NOCA|nr:hypothetical protein [Rhodococcus kyotonensis]SNS58470.1 hypothetical protein SAMN05421642_103386 [Rhodococcus kyotonensis]
MAVSGVPYGLALQSLAAKEINLASDTLKVMLCTASYTPNRDTHRYKSSVTNEVSGTGYTAGGATLGSVTVTYDATLHRLVLKAADTVWSGSTIANARYAVIYDSTPSTDATRPLLGYVDFGENLSSTSAPFTIVWDATLGVLYLSAA